MSAKPGMQKVEGWIPTHDSDGNPVTNKNLGPGGVRRNDGTMEKMADGLRIVEDRTPGDRVKKVSPAASPIADAIIIAAVDAAVKVTIDIATPIVAEWWSETGAPAAAKGWRQLRSKLSRKDRADVGSAEVAVAESVEVIEVKRSELDAASAELEAAVQAEVVTLTAEEATRLYVEMMTALALAADRMRTLQNARIEAPIDFEALEQAARDLTTPEAVKEANRQLEAVAEALPEETHEEFVRIFGGGAMVEGVYVPIRVERVREALQLPVDDPQESEESPEE